MADGSYGGNKNFKTERARYALNDFKMTLQGKRAEGGLKPQGFRTEIDAEGVRMIASTGIDGDEDYGQIKATVELKDAFLIMGILESAPRRFHPGQGQDIAIAAPVFNRQTNKREVKHQMTIRIGRSDAGVIYLQVSHWKTTRPKVYIEFVPSNMIRLIDIDGNPAAADKVSELMVVQYAKMMSEMLPLAMTHEYARIQGEREARKAQNGQGNRGGGNNYQRRNGGGGGGGGNNYGGAPAAAPSSSGGDSGFDFGDDLPM